MNKNKKLILGIGAALLLTSSIHAFDSKSNMKCNNVSDREHCKMMKKSYHHKKRDFIKIMRSLDLTKSQRMQIKQIIRDSRKNLPNPASAFSDTKFDKELFIKLSKDKRDARIEKRAEVLSKVYNILTDVQKKDLKTLLDAKEIMKRKYISRGFNDKNWDDRR